MAEDMQPVQATTATVDASPTPAATPADTHAPAPDAENVDSLPVWAQRVIGDLRKESASHRRAKSEAEKAAQAQAEQAAKEQGKWRELAEQYEPQAKRTQELEAFVAELLERETASVPDKYKKLIPQGDALATLRWVQEAKAAGVLAAPVAPQTDATEKPSQKSGLTDEQRQELAAIYGVDPRYIG